MVKGNNTYKYIYSFILFTCILVHFLYFVRNDKCKALNTGFAFGLMEGTDLKYIVLIYILCVIVILILMLVLKKKADVFLLIWTVILSSGIFIDRVYGGICDYISLPGFSVFNLLDAGIVINMFLIFAGIIKNIWKK